jgi:hypothetical protein
MEDSRRARRKTLVVSDNVAGFFAVRGEKASGAVD